MPTPAIIKGSDNFFTNIYEGNGTGQKVGNFQSFTNNGTIAKSCIFDRASSGRMNIDYTSAGTNTKKCTISLWFKLGNTTTASGNLISAWGGTGYLFQIIKYADNHGTYPSYLMFQHYDGGSYNSQIRPNRSFEDRSKWYHLMYVWDSTESTSSDRVKIYIDGDQITSFSTSSYPSTNDDFVLTDKQSSDNTTVALGTNASQIGGTENQFFDGYLAEVNVVDGSALGPSTFGLTDTSTNRWIPKTLSGITYGDNGSRLTFANTAGLTIGDDTSGNGNDFTISNIATTDITTDSPTQNFMVWDVARNVSHDPIMSEGNLKVGYTSGAGSYPASRAGKEIPQSGKWYWEVKCTYTSGVAGITNAGMGVVDLNIIDIPAISSGSPFNRQSGGMGSEFYGGFVFTGLFSTSIDLTISTAENIDNNDYMLFAFDMDNGKAWWGWNNSSAGSSVVWFANDGGTDGDPGAGTNPTVTFNPSSHRFVPTQGAYAPGSGYPGIFEYNFGQKTYAFTAPTGFGGLSQNNFPATGKGIPGFTWIKNRDGSNVHTLQDSNRGANEMLYPSGSDKEYTVTDGVQKFLKGGCQIEDDAAVNTSGNSYVAWNWVGNGGTTTANTDGSGASLASTVQANPTAGFSIVTYAGSSSGAKTVAHGLSQIPEMIWIKNRTDNSTSWFVYHINASYASMVPYDGNAHYYLNLDGSGARGNGDVFNNTAPTNKVFSIQAPGSSTNGSGKNYVAYCFHSVHGFSQIGKYIGNGNADGTFVYTGFKPAWLMVKCLSPSGTNWIVWDNTRSKFNPCDNVLYPDLTQAETASGNDMDFLSNGFKARGTNGNYNTSSRNYTYMAFAEHPLEGNGTNPATAL